MASRPQAGETGGVYPAGVAVVVTVVVNVVRDLPAVEVAAQ